MQLKGNMRNYVCRWADTHHVKQRQALICQKCEVRCDRDLAELHRWEAGEHSDHRFKLQGIGKSQNFDKLKGESPSQDTGSTKS